MCAILMFPPKWNHLFVCFEKRILRLFSWILFLIFINQRLQNNKSQHPFSTCILLLSVWVISTLSLRTKVNNNNKANILHRFYFSLLESHFCFHLCQRQIPSHSFPFERFEKKNFVRTHKSDFEFAYYLPLVGFISLIYLLPTVSIFWSFPSTAVCYARLWCKIWLTQRLPVSQKSSKNTHFVPKKGYVFMYMFVFVYLSAPSSCQFIW